MQFFMFAILGAVIGGAFGGLFANKDSVSGELTQLAWGLVGIIIATICFELLGFI